MWHFVLLRVLHSSIMLCFACFAIYLTLCYGKALYHQANLININVFSSTTHSVEHHAEIAEFQVTDRSTRVTSFFMAESAVHACIDA